MPNSVDDAEQLPVGLPDRDAKRRRIPSKYDSKTALAALNKQLTGEEIRLLCISVEVGHAISVVMRAAHGLHRWLWRTRGALVRKTDIPLDLVRRGIPALALDDFTVSGVCSVERNEADDDEREQFEVDDNPAQIPQRQADERARGLMPSNLRTAVVTLSTFMPGSVFEKLGDLILTATPAICRFRQAPRRPVTVEEYAAATVAEDEFKAAVQPIKSFMDGREGIVRRLPDWKHPEQMVAAMAVIAIGSDKANSPTPEQLEAACWITGVFVDDAKSLSAREAAWDTALRKVERPPKPATGARRPGKQPKSFSSIVEELRAVGLARLVLPDEKQRSFAFLLGLDTRPSSLNNDSKPLDFDGRDQ